MTRRSKFATDFSVGFVAFLATVVVILGLLFVETGWRVLSQRAEYRIRLPSASGLRTGTKVYLLGINVGSVKDIFLADDPERTEVEVTVGIESRCRDRIREGSYAWLQTEGLLGDTTIHIRPAPLGREPLKPGAVIPYKPRSLVEEFVGEEISSGAADLLGKIIDFLETINKGEGTIGMLVKDSDLYKNLTTLTESMDTATREFTRIARSFDDVLREIKEQRSVFGKLLLSEDYARTFSELLTEARSTLGNLREVASDLKERRAGERFSQVLERLDRASASLESILGKIESGEGSIGMLVHDPSIAAGLRDILLGVQETEIVRNMVRRAERFGREAYLRGVDLSEREVREARRAKTLASLSSPPQGTEGVTGSTPKAGPDVSTVPTVLKETEPKPVPGTGEGSSDIKPKVDH